MTIIINGTTGISGVDGSASVPALKGNDADTGIFYPTANEVAASAGGATVWNASSSFGFKNRIINGAMVIDQRNAGASVTPSNSYTLDRWYGFVSQASKFTVQQNAGSVTPPAGFTNYLGITSSSAYSITSTDTFGIAQYIEGFNTADLDFGKSTAKTITLSFWVQSSLTGTFGGAIANSSVTRSYPFSYSIPVANTWTQVSVTIAGDTSGSWVGATNGLGMRVWFGVGCGSTFSGTAGSWAGADYRSATGATSVVGTSGATFYITGVQLEKGSTATSFDYRPYGTELNLCQRYAQKNTSAIGEAGSSDIGAFYFPYQVSMRTTPTVSLLVGTNMIDDVYVAQRTISSPGALFGSAGVDYTNGVPLLLNSSSLTTGNMLAVFPGALLFSAEL
jgi:hypothetical protein